MFGSSIAFLFVVLGQTELFTAYSTMAVLPVFDRRASLSDLGGLWGATCVSNLLGCMIFAGLIGTIGPLMNIVSPSAFATLANALVPLPWWTILLSGVVAGWLVAASRDTIGRIMFTLIVTGAIGFGPFHHAILGTTKVVSAMLLGQGITVGDFVYFLLRTTIGNIIGGAVFVGLLNYGHIELAGTQQDVDFEAETTNDS